jgi:hypothetical protein
MDDLSFVQASDNAWLVSNTKAGCYLLSPRQREGSGLAIGWHPNQGIGLFLVGFPLAMRPDKAEPLLIQAGGTNISGSGRMIGSKLLFVPLEKTDMASVLRELHDNGTLWLEIRHTWITHAGLGLPAALATYGTTCTAPTVTSR